MPAGRGRDFEDFFGVMSGRGCVEALAKNQHRIANAEVDGTLLEKRTS